MSGLIARETEHARHGRPAHIIAKMNALLDKNISWPCIAPRKPEWMWT